MIPPQARAAVLAYARLHDLFRPGPLLVAVSGGTDSTALLLLLADLAPELGLLLHVAHFDHRARPAAAAADAAFVAALAATAGAAVRIGRAERRPASEDEARRSRYTFLRRAAAEAGATAIATGHTRDDQAETVLLHATRGSGLAGLGGMQPSRDGLIRPFLTLTRSDTAAICAAAGIAPREDPSNRSLRFARNRMRRRVIPELERINPQAGAALARLAEAAAAGSRFLERAAGAALAAAVEGDAVRLDRLDPLLRDEALAGWWERATGRSLGAAGRLTLGRLAAGTAGSAAADLPGGRALREYRRLVAQIPAARAAGDPPEPIALRDGTPADWCGWTIVLSADRAPALPLVAAAPPAGQLVVRGRRGGDRIGAGARTKVQDLLTDAKVPARLRDAHPLVATADGVIWWVVGLEHAMPAGDGARWLGARPPAGMTWSISERTGSIESPTRQGKDERHELR